jgi:hypothetical protein
MKRIVTAAIAASLLAGAMGPPSNAEEARQRESRRERQCRYQWLNQGTWTAREERLTAECVVARWPVPGGLDTFERVLMCESGFNRLAFNPNGPYVGLAQHALGYWPSRLAAYTPTHWTLRPRWQNSRSAIAITARMVRAVGWGPWSCY